MQFKWAFLPRILVPDFRVRRRVAFLLSRMMKLPLTETAYAELLRLYGKAGSPMPTEPRQSLVQPELITTKHLCPPLSTYLLALKSRLRIRPAWADQDASGTMVRGAGPLPS